jgi:hypothetical protein|tara:strand:- start:5807 stop:6148 length:342 start_codon:yes stop_codon:yes gene_type:complete
MSDIEMFHVGQNEDGDKLYNLRYVKGGMSLPTPSMTEAQALARINGTEVEIVSVKPVEEVVTVTVTEETTVIPDYKSMKKIELEALMREHNIELDRRKSKADLLAEVDAFFKG